MFKFQFSSTFSMILLSTVFCGTGMLSAADSYPKNVLYAQPIATSILSGFTDHAIVSVAYERSLTGKGLALLVPLHAGYYDDESESQFALGFGWGVRKYIGRPFSGSYLTLQSDYVYDWDEYTPWSYSSKVVTEDFVSITQLSFGYK